MRPVTVITPSLPDRFGYRQDCIETVAAQEPSLDGHAYIGAHLIGIDYGYAGVAATLNKLWPQVDTEWTLVLADDDLIDTTFTRDLLAQASWGNSSDGRFGMRPPDIHYAYCRVVGRPEWNPNQPFDAAKLRQGNYIPATALIRTALIRELGGWREGVQGAGHEDWDFWLRALDAGARFRCLQSIRWTYRFHGKNLSTNGVSRA